MSTVTTKEWKRDACIDVKHVVGEDRTCLWPVISHLVVNSMIISTSMDLGEIGWDWTWREQIQIVSLMISTTVMCENMEHECCETWT